LLGSALSVEVATEDELPLPDAVASYCFNSALLSLDNGAIMVLAPEESRENPRAHAFLDRVLDSNNPVKRIEYFNLRQSMHNGGGPACLRLRIQLSESDVASLGARMLFSAVLDDELVGWVKRHYRDRLLPGDLRDPKLARESFTALDELTGILQLGSIYDFQKA
ncbi:MAG: N-succinylarginine dihydrolase, partial [Polyangiaceae bacterium]